ncbi:hypothetical protein COY90_03295 [Candidatus Roizmanbacteria bacterium CG_4_10_14_0_8_um_filter_39_9]|uniref:O-antigen ligase-related domain-containing protein n=1 Tax=Candidatus Roizmanbacteria bacterium CG_4_10_14_0_8_um_filter_39_9 TaxID=1974829 RepID=A0A2M7QDT2_9BACT|nr:MAG: hypothetical protein COY90_03295 [Candidatus Roizmanbacteria bacterium CG_4_10_14_0_8_um_filter_39_9]
MKKLLNWLDTNLIKILTLGYIFVIPLYPKLPVSMVNYTYIAIRVEDFYVAALVGIFIVQLLRRKIKLQTRLLIPFVIFWVAVSISYLWGFYVQKTIIINHLGLLHALRRIEYMSAFFIFASSIQSKKNFLSYFRVVIAALLTVSLYGVGQKFLGWPAVQTMNPEYAKGYILILDANARISSTFGGHYDLAAYLVFLLPLVLAAWIYFKNKWVYFLIFTLSLFCLILTASRVSYGAYIVSTMLFLIFARKWKMLLIVALVTGGLTLTSGTLTNRLTRTFQQKQIFIDKRTGQTTVPRKLNPNELPVGDYVINKTSTENGATDVNSLSLQSKDAKQAIDQIREDIRARARQDGRTLTQKQEEQLLQETLRNLKVVTTMLPDISFATRLQVEWPRAIKAFIKYPILGKGPSAITEATDNDFLRWLGEFGLFGTLSFLAILFLMAKELFLAIRSSQKDENILLLAVLFSMFGLLINATYIDVFEASKVAYQFWMIMGLFIGFTQLKKLPIAVSKPPIRPKKK